MQEPRQDGPQHPFVPPQCTTCGQRMRLVTAMPDTPFINLQRATFVCECGATSDALFADKE
jgi:predicted nucleic acid-binding Zn ribbon protein